MLFFTGFARTASDVSKYQIEAIKNKEIEFVIELRYGQLSN